MTDKEQINKCECTCDECGAVCEPFWEKENKEQIIIDGVNVLECEHYEYKSFKDCEMRYPESGDCEIGLLNYLFNGNLDIEKHCIDNPNCYFKQLARKTQECDRYRTALKEIKEIVKINCEEICGRKLEDCNDFLCPSKNIIDIINKTKDGG